MAKKTTLRERFAQYDFVNTEDGAQVELHWRLSKSEPVSTKHSTECHVDEDSKLVLIDNDKQMSNFASGWLYKMEDGTAFKCEFKLTPVSTDEDGKPTGFKTYYSGIMYRKGAEVQAFCLDSTAIKDRLFGRQAWSSQKGPKVGAVPKSKKEVRDLSEAWTEELVGHLNEVERILLTYTNSTLMPDLTWARRVCKFKARRHAEALYKEWAEQERAENAERKAKAIKKAKVSDLTTNADFLAAMKASGISLAEFIAEAQAAMQQ